MKRQQGVICVLALVCLAFLGSCSSDPNVRKQKYVDSGNKYMEVGKAREAAIEFQNAVKIDPGFAAAHFGLAQSFARLGNGQGTYNELLKTVELDPNNLKAQLELANFLLMGYSRDHKTEHLDQARQKAEFVLSKDPNSSAAYSLLSNIAANQQKPQEALANLQKAISIAPKDPGLQLNLAIFQASQHDLATAEATAKKAIQMEPRFLQAYQFLAEMYGSQKRLVDYENILTSGINAVPNNLMLRLQLASFYLQPMVHKPEQAQQAIAEAKKMVGDKVDGRSEIAQFEYSSGNVDQAFQDYASILNDHPKDTGAKGRYAELLLQKGRDSEASKQIDELLKMSPNDVRGREIRAQIMLKQGKAADTIPLLQAVIKDDPKEAMAHHFLGVAFAATGDPGQAEAEWREAVRLNPNSLLTYRALAAIAQSKGDYDLLETCVNAMLKLQPRSPEGYLRKATLDFARKNFPGAEEDLKRAIEIAPNDPDTYSSMAEYRLSQKKIPDAQNLFEKALAVSPNAVRPMQGLVNIFVYQKQPDKAKARLREQIAKSPNTGGFYLMLAALQADAKDFAAAEITIKEGMSLDPNSNDALLLLARVHAAEGKPDQAISDYQTYIQKNPKDLRAYLAIGGIEEGRKNIAAAKQMYQKALDIDPDSPMANNNLAYLMLEQGDNVDQAITMAQSARRKQPQNPNIADTLGYAYIKKGVYSSAVELLEEASKQEPGSASVHYHLGLAYAKTNNAGKAREQFTKAAQLAPDSAEGLAAKKELQSLGGKG